MTKIDRSWLQSLTRRDQSQRWRRKISAPLLRQLPCGNFWVQGSCVNLPHGEIATNLVS